MNVHRSLTLANTLIGTTLLTCSVFCSAGSVRAATFGFSLEGLTGSGTLQFDDRSLTGEDLEILSSTDFIDGALSWNFLAGDADLYLGEDEDGTINIVPVPYFIGSHSPGLVDRIDNFEEPGFFGDSKFVFEKGVLVGIENYVWNGIAAGRSSYAEEIFTIGRNSPFASLSAEGDICAEETCLSVSISRSDLPIHYFTIEPWKNPNSHNVPEPTSLLASGLALGGFLLQKKQAR